MAEAVRWVRLVLVVLAFLLVLVLVGAPTPPLFAGLLGAMAVTLTADDPPMLPAWSFRAAQAVIGVSVAVQIDPEALRAVGVDVVPIVITILATVAVSVAVGQLLRLHGVDMVTATFSSIAGGASGMVALADDYAADARIVMVNQYLRVLFILLTLPLVVTLVFTSGAGAGGAGALHLWSGGLADYAFVALALLVGVLGGRLLRLPSPALLGPLVAGIALAAVPWFGSPVVPGWLRAAGFLLLGAQVGLRFTRATLRWSARMMPTAVVVLVVSVAACAGLGLVLAAITGESRLDAYLATTPGGLPAVLAASTETSSNLTFVTAAQTIRLLLVLLLTPVVVRVLFTRRVAE